MDERTARRREARGAALDEGGSERRERTCRHRTLARSRGTTVTLCTCGHVHVAMGSVTVRLDPDQLGDLSGTLGRALLKMRTSEQRPAGTLLC